jgi:hypothetical protein
LEGSVWLKVLVAVGFEKLASLGEGSGGKDECGMMKDEWQVLGE